jgi:predicted nuclease of predicted toxin-antitoxin system
VARYLIDVNLPYYFSLWRGARYLHVRDLDDSMSDEALWAYAREGDWTIVTKDADFSSRAMLEPPPPRVIHVRLGNLRMREFHRRIAAVWLDACALSEEYRLVSIFDDHLEGIGRPLER